MAEQSGCFKHKMALLFTSGRVAQVEVLADELPVGQAAAGAAVLRRQRGTVLVLRRVALDEQVLQRSIIALQL